MDCDSTDLDTGSDAADTVESEDVSLETSDDGSSDASSCGDDSDDATTWTEPAEESSGADASDDSGCGDDPSVVAATTDTSADADGGDTAGGHCAPADSPTLSDPSLGDPAVNSSAGDVSSSGPATPASQPAAGSGAPLVALPDHVGVPGERLGSPDGARIVTPGVFTPTSFDAAGNATHVSYSGVIEPSRETVVFGGNQTMPASTHPQVLATQALINQTNADMATSWLTGVTVDRSGSSPTYYGAGKPFDDFGDALGNERDPQ